MAGLILRLLLILVSPRYGYLFDHDDQVRWGIQATDQGVLTLYDHPPPRWNIRCRHDGRWVITQRPFDRVYHYPPVTAYMLYASGLVFKVASADRLINTVISRAIFSFWGIGADFVLAWGCAALVAIYGAGRAVKWTYLLVLFLPPLWWDSTMWGQFDAVPLAGSVWFVWALVRRRWVLAGVLLGLAAAVKPQAVLCLPVLALAVWVCKPRWKPLLTAGVAAGVLLVVALPFTLHGGWAWLRLSYLSTLFDKFPSTTLNAFNLWYADLLVCDSRDVSATWLGLSKDSLGRLFVLLSLTAGFVWMARRWRGDGRGLVLWSGLVILAFVMLATRVHERYLLMVLPFLMVAAMWWRRFWPGLAALLVVACCQLTWPLWLGEPAGGWDNHLQAGTWRYQQARAALSPQEQETFPNLTEYLEPQRRKYLAGRAETITLEWCVTILALLGAAGIVGAAVFRSDMGKP
ncbi:MAG: DUF2029 domain-containing protein [Phycisphaerae bacterium]|nr:DUF2029 domain-containing protein [Phycisphaerae bacterium]